MQITNRILNFKIAFSVLYFFYLNILALTANRVSIVRVAPSMLRKGVWKTQKKEKWINLTFQLLFIRQNFTFFIKIVRIDTPNSIYIRSNLLKGSKICDLQLVIKISSIFEELQGHCE